MTRGMPRDLINNTHETSLFWGLFLTKSLVNPNEMNDGYKIWKQNCRVTLMICTNAFAMYKLELVTIHRFQNPSSFKNISKNDFPVHVSLKSQGLEEMVVLLLDNASCHEISILSGPKSKVFCLLSTLSTTSIL